MLNANTLKIGERFSRHSYGTIVDVKKDKILVRNSEGFEWGMDKDIAEKELCSASQYKDVVHVNRTELTEVIASNKRVAMTVNFNKKPDAKEQKALLKRLILGGPQKLTTRILSGALKKLETGPERTMIGYHFGEYDAFGRLVFTDMEATDGHMRTVDPRTVNWCVVAGTKYELK